MSQLTNYIQKELDKGFSKDLITKKLLQAGYSQQEISESFQSLESAEPLLRRKSIEMPHMNFHITWSKWVFGVLAIVLVAVFGYLMYLYDGELPAFEEVEVPSSCDGLSLEEKNICLLQLAQQGEDVCNQLSTEVLRSLCTDKYWEKDSCNFNFIINKDTAQREQCLWEQAVATQDGSYCTRKVHDKIECLVQLAQETGDAGVCGHYTSCYNQYAVLSKDAQVCDTILEDYEKQTCIDFYTNNINS